MAATSATGFPVCILTPCSNSHPFDERRILVTRTEEDAVKIGRSVVRLQPSSNNAIFDCKVLSRNHAVLWANGAGHFMIKDTRSSNGTFINNERLSASGEENEPRELFSGDILQLGVEIIDTAKKVASGCVTCIVRLLNERGEECAGRPKADNGTFPTLLQQIPPNYTLVKNEQLFILDQYVKEAQHRENQLGLKLQTLEEQLRIAQEALQAKWQEHVDQELLLSRIEQLESQLDRRVRLVAAKTTGTSTAAASSSSKNGGGANDANAAAEQHQRLATELRELAEDRGRIEQMAKESLRAMQEQVQETAMKLHDAEMSLINVEEECSFLRQRCADFETQMGRQRDDYDALLVKYNSSKTAAPPPSPPPPPFALDAQKEEEESSAEKQAEAVVDEPEQQQQQPQPVPETMTATTTAASKQEVATQMPGEDDDDEPPPPPPVPKKTASKEAETQVPDGVGDGPSPLLLPQVPPNTTTVKMEAATQMPPDGPPAAEEMAAVVVAIVSMILMFLFEFVSAVC
ncbi:hypothetical protein niasHT_001928 [Heterodera trifolii]|uniref:FHA domain-containing protein n=1 Tax=Heterodera trifolii TaxID=157864 RepID=A0ABD2LSJ8_9BILA